MALGKLFLCLWTDVYTVENALLELSKCPFRKWRTLEKRFEIVNETTKLLVKVSLKRASLLLNTSMTVAIQRLSVTHW
jgi:hypothetical protein